jgi:hypothetical protein
MKWIGERISVFEGKEKTSVVIYPENVFWQKGLMGAWFAMWLVIGGVMFWSLSLELSEKERIIVFIFLSFWLFFAVRVGRAFFWLMWGKEMIKIDSIALTYKKSIRNYGKAIPYYVENIKKISLHQPKENSFQSVYEASPWIRGGERIEFEYLGKNIRFARKLSEKESKLLYQLITKKMEEYLKLKQKKEKHSNKETE